VRRVFYAFLPALMPPSLPSIRRAAAVLALLPSEAAFCLAAAARALYRVFRSHRGLLEWVPAADAEGASGRDLSLVAARVAALLALPSLFNPSWALPALSLAALFGIAPGWMRLIAAPERAPEITLRERDRLMDLARATWRFFESEVPEDGPGLPPDNVQLDPPVGRAQRTSPTNIGLYLLATASAHFLNLIDGGTLLRRAARTAETLENLEKWHGHLYNWYDTQALKPLRPRYVSSVDSGNLAASLLTVGAMVAPLDGGLSRRLGALAAGMDFSYLYDASRDLFHIGFDAERGALSSGHYDLLASESRILSFAAMALKQVPVKHWSKLGRGMARAGKSAALISWSGTMFEYLMPLILLRAPADSLIGRTERAVVRAQRTLGAPWGVSESGYNAFDL
jgi:cyclic beta-1,2-glucan synthetase